MQVSWLDISLGFYHSVDFSLEGGGYLSIFYEKI